MVCRRCSFQIPHSKFQIHDVVAMIILGIESSCDETALALLEIQNGRVSVRANLVASQIPIHEKTGGVVPEVAAREHVGAIMHLARQLPQVRPDLIAVTRGPGLLTSLLVGTETAKALAFSWDTPLLGINHLEGHIVTGLLARDTILESDLKVRYPALALVVSGGHTELVVMRRPCDYMIIGETRDDAAGEAFDKVAQLLGLPYPGGPAIERCARLGNPRAFEFPRPMMHNKSFDFSFSGLKTSVWHTVERVMASPRKLTTLEVNNIAASFSSAVSDVLVAKTVRAQRQYGAKTVFLGGGVAANKMIRAHLARALRAQKQAVRFIAPRISLSGDNAVMIALAALFRVNAGARGGSWRALRVDPNLKLKAH